MAHGKIENLPDQFCSLLIISAGTEGADKTNKIAVIFRAVFFLEHPVHHILAEQLQFSFFCDAVTGIQTDPLKIILNDVIAESVNRRDLRMMNQYALPLQVLIFRIRGKFLFQRILQSAAHLSGCRSGERHHEQPVDIHRMVRIRHHTDNPFDEHGRFAGTRCRRNQKTSPAVINDFFLFLSPFRRHGLPPSRAWPASSPAASAAFRPD